MEILDREATYIIFKFNGRIYEWDHMDDPAYLRTLFLFDEGETWELLCDPHHQDQYSEVTNPDPEMLAQMRALIRLLVD